VSGDTFACCSTPMLWPTRTEDRTCPDCGTVWERELVDLGAGARIKAAADDRPADEPDVVPDVAQPALTSTGTAVAAAVSLAT
jgi:hypothetical protein